MPDVPVSFCRGAFARQASAVVPLRFVDCLSRAKLLARDIPIAGINLGYLTAVAIPRNRGDRHAPADQFGKVRLALLWVARRTGSAFPAMPWHFRRIDPQQTNTTDLAASESVAVNGHASELWRPDRKK